MPTADNQWNSLDPDSARQKCQPWSESKLFDTLMVVRKQFFKKVEKNLQTTKQPEKILSNQRDMGLVTSKPVFGGLRTTKAQTSLGIRADRSAPLLFAFCKVPYQSSLWPKYFKLLAKQVFSQRGPYEPVYEILVQCISYNIGAAVKSQTSLPICAVLPEPSGLTYAGTVTSHNCSSLCDVAL